MKGASHGRNDISSIPVWCSDPRIVNQQIHLVENHSPEIKPTTKGCMKEKRLKIDCFIFPPTYKITV